MTEESDLAACARCGRVRRIKPGRVNATGLCKDCISCMTKEEIELWRTPIAA